VPVAPSASPDPLIRRKALERLFDSRERLKSLAHADKRTSVTLLLDRCATEPSIRQFLEVEAQALSNLGNGYLLRHHEVRQVSPSWCWTTPRADGASRSHGCTEAPCRTPPKPGWCMHARRRPKLSRWTRTGWWRAARGGLMAACPLRAAVHGHPACQWLTCRVSGDASSAASAPA